MKKKECTTNFGVGHQPGICNKFKAWQSFASKSSLIALTARTDIDRYAAWNNILNGTMTIHLTLPIVGDLSNALKQNGLGGIVRFNSKHRLRHHTENFSHQRIVTCVNTRGVIGAKRAWWK